jgi:hypothetical protein
MAYEYGKVKIQLRRDTAANLASVVLANGEPAYATDSELLKIGNGSDNFATLSGIAGGGGGGGSEVNDLSSVVTWANVPDGNITESSVVQHSGALTITESQIADLGNYVASGSNITVLNNNNTYVPKATHAGFNQYDIAYWNNASADTLASSLGVRFVIYQGKMGVGKSNPAYQLDVASTGNFDGPVLAQSFVKESGTSSQFLKADGSIDSTAYTANVGSVTSDTGVAGGGSAIANMVTISSSDYSGITPNSSTLYFVTG